MEREIILQKLRKYCDYQDRCHEEVRTKLLNIKVYGDELEEVMATLITEDYLNEERYARSYARGKFRMKRWGKRKILQHLKFKKISAYCIKKAMTEIDDDEYRNTLETLLSKYIEKQSEANPFLLYQKAQKHGISKGYENALIKEVLQDLIKHEK